MTAGFCSSDRLLTRAAGHKGCMQINPRVQLTAGCAPSAGADQQHGCGSTGGAAGHDAACGGAAVEAAERVAAQACGMAAAAHRCKPWYCMRWRCIEDINRVGRQWLTVLQ